MEAVFRKSLRDSRRTMIWLSIGLAVYLLVVLSFFPTLVEQQEEIDELISKMPTQIINMAMGGLDIEQVSISDPAVFLHGRFISWMVLILGVTVMMQAFNAITNAERDGTMDLLMSYPIPRRDMLLARFANTVVTVLVVLTACFFAAILGTMLVKEFDLPIGEIAIAVYGAFFIIMVPAGFAYMLAALVPSRQHWIGAASYTLLFGSYLLFGFVSTSKLVEGVRGLLIFNYYNAGELVNHGVNVGNFLVLTVVSIVFFTMAWWAIDRKQLGI